MCYARQTITKWLFFLFEFQQPASALALGDILTKSAGAAIPYAGPISITIGLANGTALNYAVNISKDPTDSSKALITGITGSIVQVAATDILATIAAETAAAAAVAAGAASLPACITIAAGAVIVGAAAYVAGNLASDVAGNIYDVFVTPDFEIERDKYNSTASITTDLSPQDFVNKYGAQFSTDLSSCSFNGKTFSEWYLQYSSNDWAASNMTLSRQAFSTAITTPPPRIDPLILDLDGDGIETTNVKAGTYFDHDGNGFAEQTGWAGADDGLLVLDRNGDGIINDGKELFGDQTILKNGSRAADGFQALAEWDDNADGQIDANDSLWATARIWKDINGDGFSSADEFHTLSEQGIASISLTNTATNTVDASGNTMIQSGSFTKTDGTTGQAGSFVLQRDTAFTIAKELVDVPVEIAGLPDLQGYGNVFTLHQAMARDTSGALKALVESFAATTDVAVRNDLMDQILFTWTGSNAIDPASRGGAIDARKLAVLENMFGQSFVGTSGVNPNVSAVPLLNQSYQGMVETFYAQLMAQTHLKPLYDLVAYSWDTVSQSIKGDLTPVIAEIENQLAIDPGAGKVLFSEFTRTLSGFQAAGMMNFDVYRSRFAAKGEDFAWLIDSIGKNIINGTTGNDSLSGGTVADAIAGYAGNDSLTGNNGNDILYGGDGDDSLFGGSGNDLLDGGAGNDYLSGGDGYNNGNDTFRFGIGGGQDTVYDRDWVAGQADTVEFGAGLTPDSLELYKEGNNLKIAIKGTADSLTIQNWFGSWDNRIEQFKFADGTVLNHGSLEARGIKVMGGAGNDSLSGSTLSGTPDQLYGGDGADTLYGQSGNDILYGEAGADTLHGGNDQDILYGGDGDDSLFGGSGNDLLDGGAGNDYLSGGASYGNGNDRYIFGIGSGQDTIYDYDWISGQADTIEFGTGITPADIQLYKIGSDLKIIFTGLTDTLTIQRWFDSTDFRVEQFKFADGTVLTSSALEARGIKIMGTAGNDTLSGSTVSATPDSMYGGDGNGQTISIIAYVRDERQEGWGKLVEITNLDGYAHRFIIPLSDFAGSTNDLIKKLLSLGILVPVDKKSRDRLRNFLLNAHPLDGRRALIVRKCGWRHRVFVMPDRAIGTPPEMVIYDPGANASSTARFAVLGSSAQWQTGTGALCVGNSRLIFSVCCSFAAAMLTPLGIEGGCFNLVCTSSAGKTTILGVSASVCGGPDYLRTWWTTDNGLAEVAAGHNDSLLILDEMGQVLPAKIGDIAYMLVNGKGKIRASPRSAIQPERTWRLLALSSGEITISEHMDEAGKKIKPGQEVRIVDIPADAGAGYGIFECLHGFESPEKLAMTLEHSGSQAYGSPLVGFLEQFTADYEKCVTLTRSFMEDFLSQYQPPDATPQQRRVIRRFAVVAAAGEIAGHLGVTGWQNGEAIRGVAKCLRDWWDDKHGNDRHEADRIIAQVHRFIESQGGGRFYDLRDTGAPDNETVCFRHQINEQYVDFFIRPDVFHKEVCTGFDPAKVCRLLRDRGILIASGKRNTIVQRVDAYGKKGCRFYCLRISTAMWK